MKDVFDRDEVKDVLRSDFYRAKPLSRPRKAKANKPKPDHYEVICISLYNEDLARLDAKVAELKKRGHRKMSRSALIRFALDTVDLDGLPRSY
jgi:hypothetical protein